MRGNSIELFATNSDYKALFQDVEKSSSVEYCFLEQKASSKIRRVHSFGDIELPSLLPFGNGAGKPSALIVPTGAHVQTRSSRQKDGSDHYVINDQLLNPRSVYLLVGGQFGSNILLPGQISNISEHEDSISLFATIKKAAKRTLVRVKSFHLGREALALMRNGFRLTGSAASGAEYDLRE